MSCMKLLWINCHHGEVYSSISDVFEEYAQIRCALKQQKKTLDKEIGNFDILIGATALHYGLTVVTDNVKHFELMPGVKVENWIVR